MDNDKVVILLDFIIQTVHLIQHRRPGIFVQSKCERKCHCIGTDVPESKRVEQKEEKKVDNYSDLKQKVKKFWHYCVQIVIVPIINGVVGVTSKRLKNYLITLDVISSTGLLQKAALLRTEKIVRQVLKT